MSRDFKAIGQDMRTANTKLKEINEAIRLLRNQRDEVVGHISLLIDESHLTRKEDK